MNGRIYDPTLGRFLQADPFIQAPGNSQSYNRYAYVLNNPLSYTDPSGYFFKALGKFVKKFWRVAVAAVAAYYTFGYALGALSTTSTVAVGTSVTVAGVTTATTVASTFTYATVGAYIGAGAAAGFVGGAIASGTLKGALRGAFTGAVLGGTSYANANSVTSLGEAARQTAISAAGGCATGAGSGGSCGEGARLAAMAQTLKISLDHLAGDVSTLKASEGEAVVKPGGQLKIARLANGKSVDVLNRAIDNTGMGVTVDDPNYGFLVGKTVSESKRILIQMGKDPTKILSNLGAMGESGGFMSFISQNIPGVRASSVTHDIGVGVIERALSMENVWYGTAFTVGSIPPSFALQYAGFGAYNYNYYYHNLTKEH